MRSRQRPAAAPTYREAKAAAGLTDQEICDRLQEILGDVRGISVHSASLWSRGILPPPWWARPALARVLRVQDFSDWPAQSARRARR